MIKTGTSARPARGWPFAGGLAAWVWLTCLLLTAGCAGYHLGPSNGTVAGSRSIQINPFINQTIEARLGDAVTSAVRKKVQQDGTFKLNTANGGDVIVTGVITSLNRSELSFQPSDILTVRDYYLTLEVRVRAVDRASGKVLLDRPVTGRTTMRVGSDLASGERQALPLLADDLARNVTGLLVDGQW